MVAMEEDAGLESGDVWRVHLEFPHALRFGDEEILETVWIPIVGAMGESGIAQL
jgi:hypothetical protein